MLVWSKSGIDQYNLKTVFRLQNSQISKFKNRDIETCELFKISRRFSQKQVSETNISVKTNPAINFQSIFRLDFGISRKSL